MLSSYHEDAILGGVEDTEIRSSLFFMFLPDLVP